MARERWRDGAPRLRRAHAGRCDDAGGEGADDRGHGFAGGAAAAGYEGDSDMRHSSAIAVGCVLIVLGAAPVRGAPGPSENLLLNGGAEETKGDAPSVWYAASVPAEGLRMWRDSGQSGEAYTGTASLAISNQHEYDEPVSNNWAQRVQPVPSGKTVVLKAAVRTVHADAANVCVQCWDASGEKMLAYASTPVVRGIGPWGVVESKPLVVPKETASVVVRAALTGEGQAWFDDVSLAVVGADAAEAVAKGARPDGAERIDPELVALFRDGRIVEVVPVDRDVMVLQYMQDWAHGNRDNLGLSNHDGGVRTLFAWPRVEHAPGRKYALAIYARRVTAGPDPGPVEAFALPADWDEQTSWKTQPALRGKPVARARLDPHPGWKLIDLTDVIGTAPPVEARGKKGPRPDSGTDGGRDHDSLVVKFSREDRTVGDRTEYQFVSREGEAEWKARRPLLIVWED